MEEKLTVMQRIKEANIIKEKMKMIEEILDSKDGQYFYGVAFQELHNKFEKEYSKTSFVKFEKEVNSIGFKLKYREYLLSVYEGTVTSLNSAKGAGISFSLTNNARVSSSGEIIPGPGGFDPKTTTYLLDLDMNQKPFWKNKINYQETYTTLELAENWIEQFAMKSKLIPELR